MIGGGGELLLRIFIDDLNQRIIERQRFWGVGTLQSYIPRIDTDTTLIDT